MYNLDDQVGSLFLTLRNAHTNQQLGNYIVPVPECTVLASHVYPLHTNVTMQPTSSPLFPNSFNDWRNFFSIASQEVRKSNDPFLFSLRDQNAWKKLEFTNETMDPYEFSVMTSDMLNGEFPFGQCIVRIYHRPEFGQEMIDPDLLPLASIEEAYPVPCFFANNQFLKKPAFPLNATSLDELEDDDDDDELQNMAAKRGIYILLLMASLITLLAFVVAVSILTVRYKKSTKQLSITENTESH